MINKIVLYTYLASILFLQLGCQSLKDGLEGKKNSKASDEFLIEKKSPLVLPPDFSKLPEPKQSTENDPQNEFDLQKILSEENKTEKKKTTNNNSSIEKLILDKINN